MSHLQRVEGASAEALAVPEPPHVQHQAQPEISRKTPADGDEWLAPKVVEYDADTIAGWLPQPMGVPSFRATASGTAREWKILNDRCSVWWGDKGRRRYLGYQDSRPGQNKAYRRSPGTCPSSL